MLGNLLQKRQREMKTKPGKPTILVRTEKVISLALVALLSCSGLAHATQEQILNPYDVQICSDRAVISADAGKPYGKVMAKVFTGIEAEKRVQSMGLRVKGNWYGVPPNALEDLVNPLLESLELRKSGDTGPLLVCLQFKDRDKKGVSNPKEVVFSFDNDGFYFRDVLTHSTEDITEWHREKIHSSASGESKLGGLATASALLIALPFMPLAALYHEITGDIEKEKQKYVALVAQNDPIYEDLTARILKRDPLHDAEALQEKGVVALLPSVPDGTLFPGVDLESNFNDFTCNADVVRSNDLLRELQDLTSKDLYRSDVYDRYQNVAWKYKAVFNQAMYRKKMEQLKAGKT